VILDRDAGERGHEWGTFQMGVNLVDVPFYNGIIGNFMFCQDRLQANLWQLLAVV